MTIVAHAHPFVVGVDTHAKNHALSILATPAGVQVDDGEFPTTAAGMARAIDWVARRTGGDRAGSQGRDLRLSRGRPWRGVL